MIDSKMELELQTKLGRAKTLETEQSSVQQGKEGKLCNTKLLQNINREVPSHTIAFISRSLHVM